MLKRTSLASSGGDRWSARAVSLALVGWIASLMGPVAGRAQAAKEAWEEPAAGDTGGAKEERIEVKADSVKYDREGGWIEGRGHVVVRKGKDILRADFVRVNVKTKDAHAEGNVVLIRPDGVWRGKRLKYNFETRKGDALGLTGGEKGTDP